MPNWCYNQITIEGPKEKIEKLWEDANKEDSGLLNALVPIDKDVEDWYFQHNSNWGTKWEVDVGNLELYENTITGGFDSAWAPPIEAVRTYEAENPDVKITLFYEEEGMDFAGLYDNGEEYYVEDVTTITMDIQKEKITFDEAPEDYQIVHEHFCFTERDYSYLEDEEE